MGSADSVAVRVDVVVLVSRAVETAVEVPLSVCVDIADGVTDTVSLVDLVGVRVAVIDAETKLVDEPVRELVIVFV